MKESNGSAAEVNGGNGSPHVRRFRSSQLRPARSPIINGAILILLFVGLLFLAYRFVFDRGAVRADVIDLTHTVEQVQELSTVKSHLYFAVVVQEENGNIITRKLADQATSIGMEGLGDALFQNPTMIVQLHGVATYGLSLGGVAGKIRQNDSTVLVPLPPAGVLDVKLVAADTKIVAQMKGLFRGSNTMLLQEANRHGEEFARQYAAQDTALAALATQRARDLLRLFIERGGKRAVFE
jgi:hypothetical protein